MLLQPASMNRRSLQHATVSNMRPAVLLDMWQPFGCWLQAAAAQPAQSTSAQHRGRLHAVRSNVQGTAQRTWSAGTTRLSRMGHALQLDRFNFGRTWQAVFQALSDAWERVWAAVLSAWHWVRDSAQGLGSRLRTTAQTKAQASSS